MSGAQIDIVTRFFPELDAYLTHQPGWRRCAMDA
jgi:hypothetical protein